MDKTHWWFRQGAQALSQIQYAGADGWAPANDEVYACPLCLRPFGLDALASGELTKEHAPPEWFKGRVIALTCRTCNNEAGRHFDAEAEKIERLRGMVSGEYSGPMRGIYAINSVGLNGDFHSTGGGGGMFIGEPKINNPTASEEFFQTLDRHTGATLDEFNLLFTPRLRASHRRAEISWVRSAYLIAFAALGWRYILQPSFSSFRAQFQDHANISLDFPILHQPDADPAQRDLMLIESPSDCASLLVRIGRHSVFLPDVDSDTPYSDLTAALRNLSRDENGAVVLKFSGKVIPWPTAPTYWLDLDE
jgi:hypothetical protein